MRKSFLSIDCAFIEDEPIVRVNNHIPLALCPALMEEDLTDQSLYHIYGRKIWSQALSSRNKPGAHRSQ